MKKTKLGFLYPEDEDTFLNTISELYKRKEFSELADMLIEQIFDDTEPNKNQDIRQKLISYLSGIWPDPFPNVLDIPLIIRVL